MNHEHFEFPKLHHKYFFYSFFRSFFFTIISVCHFFYGSLVCCLSWIIFVHSNNQNLFGVIVLHFSFRSSFYSILFSIVRRKDLSSRKKAQKGKNTHISSFFAVIPRRRMRERDCILKSKHILMLTSNKNTKWCDWSERTRQRINEHFECGICREFDLYSSLNHTPLLYKAYFASKVKYDNLNYLSIR